MEDRRKSYAFTLVLGRSTDTGDATGPRSKRERFRPMRGRCSSGSFPRFIGTIEQIPPMYSALHSGGERLYEIARRGETVVRAPRKIVIYGLACAWDTRTAPRGWRWPARKGTYVRVLAEDLGTAIGWWRTWARSCAMRREPFVLYESRTLEQIEAAPGQALIAPERVIPFPTIVLDGRGAADFCAGRLVPLPSGSAAKHVFVRDSMRTLVGVGEPVGALLAPRKVFV
jgi:tRNA pseudouridine55 synthase